MLFTRCPECDTTFRVTDETLKKANGQVRCGRCASVFNAYAELHDSSAKALEPDALKPRPALEQPAPAATPAAATSLPDQPPESKPAEPDGTAQSVGAASTVDVVAQAKLAAASDENIATEAGAPHSASDLSGTQVDRVLASNTASPSPQTVYTWPTIGAREHRAASRGWIVAATLAALVLVAQTIHHFRSDIAGHPTFGPWLVHTYGAFGAEVAPSWDVHQYEIIDWVATAEPNSRGLGSLKITARIQNRGPLRQPYPDVQLRLKDRWEAAVGGRLFTPAEYLRDAPREDLMLPGETARAEIELVDPGPDAYGFELDVCIEVEASLVTCGTDEVFL
jgi:predicted Zn finger-like uncharacterized protein